MSRLTVLALSTFLATVNVAVAQQPARQDTARGQGQQDFQRLTRDATHLSGFFDFYQKPDRLYLLVPPSRLGQEFLLQFRIAQGIGANGLFGGTMLNIFESAIVALERHGDRVYLVQRPHRFRASDAATNEAVRLSFASSVLESARIEATREDSSLLIGVQDWFVSDLSNVGARVRAAVVPRAGAQGRASVDRNRSYLESVRVFPRNVNVRALLTFTPGEPVDLTSVPDSRYIPVGVHYTLAALPEEPMAPRAGDDRTGFFLTVHKDFTREDPTFFVRYVNRWRLECGRPAGDGLCEPRQPITYYIDRTVPVELRPFLVAGVQAWNKAFERAGFRNAIRALPLPDSADPEDIRFATLRWNTSDQPGYGAIGPSMVDPRTGEILDADILFEANMVRGFRNAWRTLVDPLTMMNQVLGLSPEDEAAAAAGLELAHFGATLAAQGGLVRAALVARGELGPGDPVPLAYVGEALRWVTMHEVGHTLGLRHNFRSSADTPLDSLASRTWAERYGLYSSVMEYPVPNVQPRGRPNGYFYNPTVGSSDEWMIAYGYTPDSARAAALAREAARPGHAYGTDEDARGPAALDPTISVFDMSADPLAWAQQRAPMIGDLLRRLPEAVLTDNMSRAEVTGAFQSLLAQYAGAVSIAVKYVGGQYQHRDHVGDPGARPPLVAVPVARQREALQFLTRAAFDEAAFRFAPELLQQLGPERWSHWGLPNTVSGRIDYPLHAQVLGIQQSLLTAVLHPVRFAAIRDAELRFGATSVLSVSEVMLEVTRAVWSEVWIGPGRNVPAMRRDLQRAHLDRLVEFVATPPAGTPADARAVARARLVDLDRRLAARSRAARLDDVTAAHLVESRARIARALEAGLEVERR
jgi:hypothetical protein